MKTLVLSSKICCLLMATILSVSLVSATGIANRDWPDITIIVVPDNPGGAPRSAVPFVAEYSESYVAVVLRSVQECGLVSVTLESTAGDWFQTVFDSREGSILIPVSGTSGHYTLTMQTLDGVVYQGEFDII